MDQVYSNLKQNRWSVLRLLFVVVVLTAAVLQVAPTRATAPYDDEFNNTTLAGIWSWVRQDSANWSLSAVPGSMRITCQAGEINNANTTAENLLLQTAPAGDWTATAKVTGKPTANWAQVALLAYQDDNNWVKADRVFDSGNKFQVGREAAGAYTFTTVTDSIASTTSYLRLVKSGTTYTAFYSADDVTYTQIGAAQTITLSNIKIGLSCYGGTGISGAFDWIHVSTAGSPTPTNTVGASNTPTNTPIVPTATRTNTPPPGTAIRIEAGNTASFTDNGGNVWAADHSFVAGSGGIADRGAIAIANTLDDKIYQTERWGATGYNVTIPNGTYNVNLHFAETSPAITGAGQRIFNVNVEGQALNGLDVFAQAGGKNIALIKSFNGVTVTDGVLTITLTASVQATEINGIEIVPGVAGPTNTPTKTPTVTNTPVPGTSIFPLKVSSNNRYLVQQNGTTPFYPIADTTWMIYWTVSREDAEFYMDNRIQKGYNTINTSILPMPNINSTNVYGAKPFINDNITTPNEAYFAHVDWVVNKAAEKGILVFMGPAWSRDYSDNLNPTTARTYGRYIGNRYKNFDNIIWFMGGDIYSPTTEDLNEAREMAAGILEFDTRHLITYHPGGQRSSSTWFHSESWLKFNTIQTYDPATTSAYSMVLGDYNRSPVKPTWNMEPNYENENGNTPYNVRLAAGWGAFSGGFGISYGAYGIWRMGTVADWKNYLNLAGASHFANIGKAIKARAFEKLVPDQSNTMITSGKGSGGSFASAARASDGSFGMAYIPNARAITINMAQFNSSKTIKWFDPTNNTYTTVGTFANTGSQNLPARPNNSAGQSDWILIIE